MTKTDTGLRGLATISYFADDVVVARDWYARMLGVEAYFSNPREGAPTYVEFRIGDYQHELGIIDRRYAPHDTTAPGGPIAYWHVDDLAATLERLISLGASPHAPITEHGPGFVTASVIDPFGNVVGLMFNRHYLEVLGNEAGT